MTGKELRDLARETLATQLRAETFQVERAHAAILALQIPEDPDEQRASHEAMRQREEERYRLRDKDSSAMGGGLGLNMAGPAFAEGRQHERQR